MPVMTIVKVVKAGVQQMRDFNTQDNFSKADWQHMKIGEGESLDPSRVQAVGRGLVFDVATKGSGSAKRVGLIGNATREVKKGVSDCTRMFVVYEDYLAVVKGTEIGHPEACEKHFQLKIGGFFDTVPLTESDRLSFFFKRW